MREWVDPLAAQKVGGVLIHRMVVSSFPGLSQVGSLALEIEAIAGVELGIPHSQENY